VLEDKQMIVSDCLHGALYVDVVRLPFGVEGAHDLLASHRVMRDHNEE